MSGVGSHITLSAILVTAALVAANASTTANATPNPDRIDAQVHGLAPLPGGGLPPLSLRPPGAKRGETGPSQAIFPPQRITLRFNHRRHFEEPEMACTKCHTKANTSSKSGDNLLPDPAVCDGCHGTNHRDRGRVSGDASLDGQCRFCHVGYRAKDGNRVARLVLPAPNLRFSHQAHAKRNINCRQCHGEVQKLELATRDQLPRMRACVRCRDSLRRSQGCGGVD